VSDIKFEIVKKIGVLSKSEKGCPLRGGTPKALRFWDLHSPPSLRNASHSFPLTLFRAGRVLRDAESFENGREPKFDIHE
jgi:hypothetical protein